MGIVNAGGGGGSNIKSIQRGLFTFSSNPGTYTLNFTAVDISKSILTFSYTTGTKSGVNKYVLIQGQIINSTQASFSNFLPGDSIDFTVEWQITEYENVKSVQRGATSITSGAVVVSASNVSISSIDVDKSILFFSAKNQYAFSSSVGLLFRGKIASPTILTFYAYHDSGWDTNFQYQVIEFK